MPRKQNLTQSEQVQRGPWVRICNACNAMRDEVGACEVCGCPEFRMRAMVTVEKGVA